MFIVFDQTNRHVKPIYGYFNTANEAGAWAYENIKSGEYEIIDLNSLIEIKKEVS